MSVCVTSMGDSVQSQTSMNFGRAPYFLIFDGAADDVRVLKNEAPAHGAGIHAAQVLAETGVSALVTGNVGPNAFRVLDASGIAIHLLGESTVDAALRAYQEGTLEQARNASGRAHSGGRE